MWQESLYKRLRGNPYPLSVFADGFLPAASLWSGARLYTKAFRDAGLCPGDRLVLSLEPGAAFLQTLVAALWENLTLILMPPAKTADALQATMESTDARAAVWAGDANGMQGVFWPDGCEGPGKLPGTLRPTRHAPTPDVRFLLQTSGTVSGRGKWVALSDENVQSVLQTHTPLLGLTEAMRVLSVLPWHHAFGLLLDLLPALFAGAEIIRDPNNGKNTPALLHLAQRENVQYLCAVPLLLQRLRQEDGGAAFLQSLHGGIVGGAPVGANLAAFLQTTRLRAGYGQTEAAPGICLGKPGQWPAAHFLGTPLGCETRIRATGILEFRGKNAHVGFWTPDGLVLRPDPAEWVSTNDLVCATNDGYFWRGRSDDAFKMASGRRVEAGACETALRAACPSVRDALLHSPDGHKLVWYLHLSPEAQAASLPLQIPLGSLGPLLGGAVCVPPESWVRTAKGEVNRRETLRKIALCTME